MGWSSLPECDALVSCPGSVPCSFTLSASPFLAHSSPLSPLSPLISPILRFFFAYYHKKIQLYNTCIYITNITHITFHVIDLWFVEEYIWRECQGCSSHERADNFTTPFRIIMTLLLCTVTPSLALNRLVLLPASLLVASYTSAAVRQWAK